MKPLTYLPDPVAGMGNLNRVALAIVLLALAGLLLALAGCGATLPQGQVTKVPVPVECREQVPERPAMPTEAVASAQPLDAFLAALLAEIDVREGYEGKLLSALQGCTKPITSAPVG